MKIKILFKRIVLLVIGACLGLTISYFYSKNNMTDSKLQEDIKKPLYWVAPMDPNYKRDKPGKSPMGMDLVPVYKEDKKASGITISPNVINNIGVKVEPIKIQTLTRSIDTLGIIKENENNIEHIHMYEAGWIRKLHVQEIGAYIKKGQLIAKIYSPKLIEAEQELVLALKNQASTNVSKGISYFDETDYVKSSISKLESLGISDNQIQRIIKNRKADTLIDVYAPISGILSELNVKEGMYITPDQNLMTIVNLDTVWLSAEIFPNQVNEVKVGNDVIGKVTGIEGVTFHGVINFISPTVDPVTRTISVRATLDNTSQQLKPNLFMDAVIRTSPLKDVLVVPKSAVIRLKEIDYVIVASQDNYFFAQEVKLGESNDHYYQILNGLKKGDKVVVSAQFLIDSESDIQASIKRLNSSEENSLPGQRTHNHHGSH
ncbi:efflux RND transporter periplasmic adaptor subunit [Thiotrichales bacterium 19S11-10]|nr:efflux RND transporter periplasmic adaptor subunit [Thiotrichales bacterium 19S11-10]